MKQQILNLNNIQQELNSIEKVIKDNQNDNKNIYQNFITKKYRIQEIDQTTNGYCGSSLSINEQYLAYGGTDKLLKIYDIKLKKLIKEIKLDHYLQVCQFTHDQSQLYIGLSEGYAYGYDVLDGFKEIYKQQIHSDNIYNILTLKNQYLITCSYDTSIIKTDIKLSKQIFRLTGHTHWIIALDYNYKDEIIVSGSNDQSIKLWNCENQSIIINKEQVQFINNNLNILSLDLDGFLYMWKIDLINKDLIKLQQFNDQNKIFNFYQVNQDQNLLLICNNYIKILNKLGQTINKIDHGGKDSLFYDCKQLDNLKYIQIRAKSKVILAIAQD